MKGYEVTLSIPGAEFFGFEKEDDNRFVFFVPEKIRGPHCMFGPPVRYVSFWCRRSQRDKINKSSCWAREPAGNERRVVTHESRIPRCFIGEPRVGAPACILDGRNEVWHMDESNNIYAFGIITEIEEVKVDDSQVNPFYLRD